MPTQHKLKQSQCQQEEHLTESQHLYSVVRFLTDRAAIWEASYWYQCHQLGEGSKPLVRCRDPLVNNQTKKWKLCAMLVELIFCVVLHWFSFERGQVLDFVLPATATRRWPKWVDLTIAIDSYFNTLNKYKYGMLTRKNFN